ncbi:MAG: non-homologous end-joining DNA ligase [Candidatus Binatia bacterium]
MKATKIVKIAGREVELSNLEKLMYPDAGFTKANVIDYYRKVSRYILPHLKNRPITMKRFPNGVKGEFFYEKNAPSFTPSWIRTFRVPHSGGESAIRYILINDLPTLVWSANMANLEIHPFLAKAPHINVPTMVVFDLDPGEGADIVKSCEAALLVKDLLDRLNLESFVKVSGSKGIHLHVPLNTRVTYEMTQGFAHSIAQLLETERPDLIVSKMSKVKRKGKVFVDWSQNSEHKSTVAVYSLRAKKERPHVAMPVRWDELKKAAQKGDASLLFFEPEAALKRVKKMGDLFAPLLKLKQSLPKPFLELQSDAPTKNGPAKALAKYRQKRDFTKTPEPSPVILRPSRQGGQRLFVIQKHAASHLHYDLRLEMQGVLKSWAVPKGPPYVVKETRLAMATEDHPMEYARFEGTIPKGEYGGGTVMVWDIGTYELMEGNYWNGKLHIFLSGKKLKGEWVLVKAQNRNGKDNSWFWIKAGAGTERLTGKKENSSALSGRSLEEIAQAGDAVWHSNRGAGRQAEPASTEFDLESLPQARIGFMEPMLAKPVHKLPEDTIRWIYEIKLDGYRCLGLRDAKGAKLYSQKKKILNARFPEVARALKAVDPGTLIDGEIVALDESGKPSVKMLRSHQAISDQVYFYAFDLLVYRQKSLLKVPLEARRKLLKATIGSFPDRIRFSEAFASTPRQIIRAAREFGLESIIAKRKDSFYRPGERSAAWLKYGIKQS